MNLSFQKRALELKGAIHEVYLGESCPQRGSGGPLSASLWRKGCVCVWCAHAGARMWVRPAGDTETF